LEEITHATAHHHRIARSIRRDARRTTDTPTQGLQRLTAIQVRRNLRDVARVDAGMRMQAIFNGTVIAESDDTIVVEGNHYFPSDSLQAGYVEPSATQTVCAWKGTASYYDVRVDDSASKDAAWYYPEPSELAHKVKDRVAFWRGVEVRPAPEQVSATEPESFDAPEGATC